MFVNAFYSLLYQFTCTKVHFIVSLHINTFPDFCKLFFEQIFPKCGNFGFTCIVWFHAIRVKDGIKSAKYSGFNWIQFFSQINSSSFLVIEILLSKFAFLHIAITDKLLMNFTRQFTIDFYLFTV